MDGECTGEAEGAYTGATGFALLAAAVVLLEALGDGDGPPLFPPPLPVELGGLDDLLPFGAAPLSEELAPAGAGIPGDDHHSASAPFCPGSLGAPPSACFSLAGADHIASSPGFSSPEEFDHGHT